MMYIVPYPTAQLSCCSTLLKKLRWTWVQINYYENRFYTECIIQNVSMSRFICVVACMWVVDIQVLLRCFEKSRRLLSIQWINTRKSQSIVFFFPILLFITFYMKMEPIKLMSDLNLCIVFVLLVGNWYLFAESAYSIIVDTISESYVGYMKININ